MMKTVKRKLIEFPELRQTYDFDCGACALQGVMTYYGIELREEKLLEYMKSRSADLEVNGTKLSIMKATAEHWKLKAEVREHMNIKELRDLIDKDIPVILLIQAWNLTDRKKNWKNDFDDGHFVTAIGYDGEKIIFEDPSLFNRGYLTEKELEERWHDLGDDLKSHVRDVGVIVRGTPKYDRNELTHIE